MTRAEIITALDVINNQIQSGRFSQTDASYVGMQRQRRELENLLQDLNLWEGQTPAVVGVLTVTAYLPEGTDPAPYRESMRIKADQVVEDMRRTFRQQGIHIQAETSAT